MVYCQPLFSKKRISNNLLFKMQETISQITLVFSKPIIMLGKFIKTLHYCLIILNLYSILLKIISIL